MGDLNAAQIKEKILNYISRIGPSIPITISKNANLSILFTNAFLSELYSEKKLRMTYMRVGSSAVYFIEGQESQLENYIQFIKGKGKEALLLLKENKYLKDSEHEPAIRVALRAIKDFAVSFNKNEELFWRYFIINEDEFIDDKKEIKNIPKEKEIKFESPLEEEQEEQKPQIQTKKEIDILTPSKTKERKQISPHLKKQASSKKDNPFFNKVKEFLVNKNAEILEIISAGKNELILKVKTNNKEKILIAYNKKKISEKEIISAHKKSQEFQLPFLVMSLNELPKKVQDLIEALKSLSDIQKID
jgi:hypothetical protein